MRVFVTGPNGYIGKALISRGCLPLLSDIKDAPGVEREVCEKKPDLILHLAAKSKPDFCENPENRKLVIDTNVGGTRHVVRAAEKLNIPCVVFSSGQVWKGGFWERPHREDDAYNEPVNIYGMSKLGAEAVATVFDNAKIIRLSSAFDLECLAPKFEKWGRGETLFEPVFIRRSYIYLHDLIDLILEYCERISEMPKVLHLAGNETVSTFDFVYEVAKRYGYQELIRPRKWEVSGLAPRPHKAGLDTSLARSIGFRIPNFVDGVKRMKNEG